MRSVHPPTQLQAATQLARSPVQEKITLHNTGDDADHNPEKRCLKTTQTPATNAVTTAAPRTSDSAINSMLSHATPTLSSDSFSTVIDNITAPQSLPQWPDNSTTQKQIRLDSVERMADIIKKNRSCQSCLSLLSNSTFTFDSLCDYIHDICDDGIRLQPAEHFQGLHSSPNYGSAMKDKEAISEALRSRIAKGQSVGPLPVIQNPLSHFHTFCINPLGSVRYKLEPNRARPIDDPFVNSALNPPYFPMPAFALIRELSFPGCWYGCQDVANAFPCLHFHASAFPYLAFLWYDVTSTEYKDPHECMYVHTHGNFGVSVLPFIWSMYMLFVTLSAVDLGIAFCPYYLDDITHVMESAAALEFNMDRYSDHLEEMGTPEKILKRKSGQKVEILGRLFNSRAFTIAVPNDKLQRLLSALARMVLSRVSFLFLESFLGLCAFVAESLPPIFGAFLSSLIAQLKACRSRHHKVTLSAASKSDIRHLQRLLPAINTTVHIHPLFNKTSTLPVFTDASSQRGAYVTAQGFRSYLFSARQRKACIAFLEMHAVAAMCDSFAPSWRHKIIPLFIDNTSSLYALLNHRSKNKRMNELLKHIFGLALRYDFVIMPTYIKSADNVMADALSRAQFSRFYDAYLQYYVHRRSDASQ